MAHTHLFEIGYKPGVSDPVGQGLERDIAHLGLGKVRQVHSAQLYKVLGDLSAETRRRIAEDLLADPILNNWRLETGKKADQGESLQIDVWYKAGVTDVVGDSVRKGIEDLAIRSVQDVRTGSRYHLDGVTRTEVAQNIALALLVNPLVHDYTISKGEK